jgi:filamentous hemagglutinin family protein
MKNHTAQAVYGTIGAVTFGLAMNATTVQAQIIATPTGDPGATGTIVTPVNTQIDITGGTQAGSALFHSFTQFDVNQGQTANFQTPGDVKNVLTRVTNGVPSTIDGTLQLSGAKANLYFINPAGIVFGPNVNLNLPASFVGTTANSINYKWYVDPFLADDLVPTQTFSSFGENSYENPNIKISPSALTLNFSGAPGGAIMNFGKLSLQNGENSSLILIGGAIGSTTDINSRGNVVLGSATAPYTWGVLQQTIEVNGGNNLVSPSDQPLEYADTGKNWAFQQPGINDQAIVLHTGDIIVNNISASGSVYLNGRVSRPDESKIIAGNISSNSTVDLTMGFLRSSLPSGGTGYQIQVGNIQAEYINIQANGNIMAGHLKTTVINPNHPYWGILRWSGISLSGSDIRVSSMLAKSGIAIQGYPVGGAIATSASGILQVTDTVPLSELGRIRADITSPNTSETPISVAADQSIKLIQPGTRLIEGANLERDQNGYAIYRRASNPDIRVEIIAVNPENGDLILKDQATGEIIIGDKVVIRSVDGSIPAQMSGTKGLIVRFDRTDGSLAELTGAFKRKIGTNNTSQNPIDKALYNDPYNDPSGIELRNSEFQPNVILAMTMKPLAPNMDSANPLGGPLEGTYSIHQSSKQRFPLSPAIETAITQYQQRLATVNTPAPNITPIDIPTPSPNLTPIVPTPETIPAPEFSEASVLNSTIDPTDTINLSAGAIRGAAINPGGLLKVELDTRNPEGVLTRKVTTK